MKKFVLVLIAVLATTAGAFAMNLKEAFGALSNIPNINVRAADYNIPVTVESLQDAQVAAGYNLNQEQIYESATAAYTILNQVPLTRMINGGNNGEVAAFIYAEPDGNGSNEVLIVVMSGYRGSVVSILGTLDDAAKEALRNASLEIEGGYLKLEADMPGGDEFNIILNKAR